MSFTALGSRLKCVDGTLSSLGNPKRIKIEMDADYCADVDRVEEEDWYALLRLFHDTNIYQTWAYGVARNGRENISHIVVRKRGVVVGLAQSRIVQLPIIGAGIAYVMWGPLWRSRDAPTDTVALRQIIRALYNEYACKRGLLVRLYPPLFEEDHGWVIPLLKEEGFERSRLKASPRTIIMDLTPTIEDLHKSIGSQKRRELRIAEKQLEVIEGTDDALFGQFIDIYKEMVQRKKFVEPNDINQFREIQRQLPPEYKMKLMLCRSNASICAGVICSAIGSTALYLFGATSTAGVKSRGSYLLQWKQIEQLNKNRVPWYDLHGINPEENPGTYKFKSDLAGDHGRELRFVGQFEACESLLSKVCVRIGEALLSVGRSFVRN